MNISENTLWARDTMAKASKREKGLYRASFQNCVVHDAKEGLLTVDEAATLMASCGCYGAKGKQLLKELDAVT